MTYLHLPILSEASTEWFFLYLPFILWTGTGAIFVYLAGIWKYHRPDIEDILPTAVFLMLGPLLLAPVCAIAVWHRWLKFRGGN